MLDTHQRRRFTAEEVLRMVEVGILQEDEPVELIDGELLAVSPQGPRHSTLTAMIHSLLQRTLGPDVHVKDHSPIAAGPASLPEPDIAVIRGDFVDFMDRHPDASDLVLVVEISVTSQAIDAAKAAVYASAGIEHYWQIDVPARRVRAFTDPTDGEYRNIRIATDNDVLTLEGHDIQVGDLLPPAV